MKNRTRHLATITPLCQAIPGGNVSGDPGSLMVFRRLADVVLLAHFAFVAFVVLGGLAALKWPRVAWVHIPVALYGASVEFLGFVCPLTPLEVWLRHRGGQAGYTGGFVDHYVMATLYPTGLTRQLQFELGGLVLLINAVMYTLWWRRLRRKQ